MKSLLAAVGAGVIAVAMLATPAEAAPHCVWKGTFWQCWNGHSWYRDYHKRAEIRHDHGDIPGAIALWQRILDRYGDSADAAPAELALARALLASGDRAGARAHAEHLILTWQSSALVPQARRLLDTLGGAE